MSNFLRWLACACLFFISHVTLASPPTSIAGDWHGHVATPQGELLLIVRFEAAGDGYRGTLESPAQAPGQLIPLDGAMLESSSLSFSVPAIAAQFHGQWVDKHWQGQFRQQIEMPLSLKRGLPPAAAVVEGLDGSWTGLLSRNGVQLRLVLRIETGEHGTIARLDSPDMVAFDLPVAGLARDGAAIRFEVPAASVRFEAQLNEQGGQMRGSWLRVGLEAAEVTFTRVADELTRSDPERPQMPTPPFPYRAEDVSFSNPLAAEVTLAGTLTIPEGYGPFPAAVLISGSGPQDRNETVFGHQPFAVLADHLSRNGIAVLRYDDRGFAESSGDHGAATSADFASDANAAAQFLRTRPEINPFAIGFIGHSEGGMIAPLAIADNPDIAFAVLLAGPGTSTAQLAESQRRAVGLSQGMSEDALIRSAPLLARINALVADTESEEQARAQLNELLDAHALTVLGASEAQRALMVQQYTRPWYRYFLRHVPAAALAQVHVPVLALNGSLDHQVPADENLAAIEAALTHNSDVTVKRLEGLNHMFQTAKTGAMGEYRDIAETFAPSALIVISEWIAERFVTEGG